METMTSILALFLGLVIRLALPIAVTCVLVLLLRRLDASWQADTANPLPTEKPECWKAKGCPLEQREACPAFCSPLPCWQVHRLPNGYLNEKCLSCNVFIDAPVPVLHVDPRRM